MKTPFLMHFKQELESVDTEEINIEFAAYYSNKYTKGKLIRRHKTAGGKWISTYYRKARRDRRKNK